MRKPICGWRSSTSRSVSESGPGLRRISSGIASLPRSCRLPGEACQLDLLAIDPEAGCDPGRQVGNPLGVRAGVRVARVDRLGEARGGTEARGAVGPGGEPLQLGDLDHVGPVDAHLVLAVLLRPVERAVGAPHELVPAQLFLRHGRNACADRDRAGGLELDRCDPLDDRLGCHPRTFLVAAGEQDRELVSAEPEGLATLAEIRCQLCEHLVAARVAEAVVDPLEVVDVHEAQAERVALRAGVCDLALQPVVEVSVVPEPGQRVGEREPHRSQLAERGALVERNREQRPHERCREERRALPEHDEHQRGGRHQRERAGS